MDSHIVLDSNWRWLHNVGGYTNCYEGTEWDSSFCPDPVSCANNCALDGADYENTYGVKASGSDLSLGYVMPSGDVGSRVYLMDSETEYKMFKLKNKEFTFTVDVSNMPCGLNGALYFVAMDPDGGMSRFSTNKAGAKFGTGYCDAQCPHDIKFINGEANLLNWDDTTAMGKYGTCCMEMDIWEANSISQAYTAHPCSVTEQTRCEDPTTCGDGDDRYDGVCDKDGCDLNPFRLGVKNFFGPSFSGVDSSQPMTVVTQFITSDGTDSGDLQEIRRLFVQNGQVIESPPFTASGNNFDSLNDTSCKDMKTEFGDQNNYATQGGMKQMGKAMDNGMALVMSIWDDSAAYMLWLDSNFPENADPSKPGVARGTCPISGGRPADVREQYPNSNVKFADIKFGEIGSTYNH